MSTEYSVELLCSTLEVSRSSYYEWKNGKTYKVNYRKEIMEQQTVKEFWEHKRRYGARRITASLQQKNIRASIYTTRKVMKRQGLKSIQPRSFVPKTTNSKHSYTMSPNLLESRETPKCINKVWVGDITYIPLQGGKFCYLSVWMDLFSRRIIGWKLMAHMREEIVIESLRKAIQSRKPLSGTIIHSDRGGQYAGNAFRALLRKHELLQSMSNADNPYDNANMESYFSRFKAELIQKGSFLTIEDAQIEIEEYIENYYNVIRLHSSLNYNSPLNFELKSKMKNEKDKSGKLA